MRRFRTVVTLALEDKLHDAFKEALPGGSDIDLGHNSARQLIDPPVPQTIFRFVLSEPMAVILLEGRGFFESGGQREAASPGDGSFWVAGEQCHFGTEAAESRFFHASAHELTFDGTLQILRSYGLLLESDT